jgi:hypothetical protein
MPENIEKTYELRDLQADDLFVLVSIVSKIGIKEFKACFESNDVKDAIKAMFDQKGNADDDGEKADADDDGFVSVGISVALDIAAILMANIGRCKNDIYSLLANLSGMKAADIAKLPVMTFTSMVVDLVKKKEFADFFQEAVKLFK